MFKVGYSSININPDLGIAINGYYVPRFAKGFLDDLTASAVALSFGETKSILISVDNLGLDKKQCQDISDKIEKQTCIPKNSIFITSTHTHTAPFAAVRDTFVFDSEPVIKYRKFLTEKIVEVSLLALADLQPAKFGYSTVTAPDRIAYIRRYKMKDGSTMTCPPINDPNISHPIGELDKRVNILRFDREKEKNVVVLNFGLHADTIGGELISSDWVGWVRKTLDRALDGVKCLCVMGAQGDVGSTNVYPTPSDMNDTEISFDNEMKSPGMARFVGRALAGSVLQAYDKVNYVEVNTLKAMQKILKVPANVPDAKDLPLAKKYKELHDAGRDDLIPYKAMELTTVVAEALRMCRMENGPTHYDLVMSGLRIGPVALIGIPGEPFTEIGVKIKDSDGFDLILPCGLTNGYDGYFPSKQAFSEGGYEARTSPYKPSITDDIINCAKEILTELK